MTPRDSHDSDLGWGRQKPRRRRVTRDTPPGRGDTTLTPHDRADSRRDVITEPEVLNVRVEFVLIPTGTREAQELLGKQAMAVRRALKWFAEHPAPDEGPTL